MKIFATSWHPGGMNAIVPVIKQLMADGKVQVTVMGHEFSVPILQATGITFHTIADFGVSDISVGSMSQVLEQVKPNLVLTGTSAQEGKANDMVEHTMTKAARQLGIPTLAVLDIWDKTGTYYLRFSDERTGQKLDMLPDYVAVMDQLALHEMAAEGFPSNRLVLTGNPHFDGLFKKSTTFTDEQHQEVLKKVGLPGDTLFFFGANVFRSRVPSPGYWDLDVINILINVLHQIPNVGIVVRVHPRLPGEEKDLIAKTINESGANIKLVTDPDLPSQTLILAADLTVVEDSTMGLEAVYMRRPCISLQPGLIGEDGLLVSKKGIIPVGYTTADCQNLLVQAAESAYRTKLLQQSAGFSNDGKATDRVVELIYSLLKL